MFSDYWHGALVVSVALMLLSGFAVAVLRTPIKIPAVFFVAGLIFAGIATAHIQAQDTVQQAAISKD